MAAPTRDFELLQRRLVLSAEVLLIGVATGLAAFSPSFVGLPFLLCLAAAALLVATAGGIALGAVQAGRLSANKRARDACSAPGALVRPLAGARPALWGRLIVAPAFAAAVGGYVFLAQGGERGCGSGGAGASGGGGGSVVGSGSGIRTGSGVGSGSGSGGGGGVGNGSGVGSGVGSGGGGGVVVDGGGGGGGVVDGGGGGGGGGGGVVDGGGGGTPPGEGLEPGYIDAAAFQSYALRARDDVRKCLSVRRLIDPNEFHVPRLIKLQKLLTLQNLTLLLESMPEVDRDARACVEKVASRWKAAPLPPRRPSVRYELDAVKGGEGHLVWLLPAPVKPGRRAFNLRAAVDGFRTVKDRCGALGRRELFDYANVLFSLDGHVSALSIDGGGISKLKPPADGDMNKCIREGFGAVRVPRFDAPTVGVRDTIAL